MNTYAGAQDIPSLLFPGLETFDFAAVTTVLEINSLNRSNVPVPAAASIHWVGPEAGLTLPRYGRRELVEDKEGKRSNYRPHSNAPHPRKSTNRRRELLELDEGPPADEDSELDVSGGASAGGVEEVAGV